jgi:flavin reductase (DIM6/NTAB) family NADH-FMN oxidoreductase RutF
VIQFFNFAWLFFDMGTSIAFVKYLSQYRVDDPRKGIQYGQVFVWWQALSGAVQVALVVAIGNCSGRDSDKLEAHGIATSTAKHVKPPLMPECIANLECRVIETRLVNRFNLFVLEVVAAWINPALRNAKTIHHCGYGAFIVDGERIELPSAKP